jgi:hypothetical protein
VTANLAAKYHDPLSVGVGAVIGLWAAATWPSSAVVACSASCP